MNLVNRYTLTFFVAVFIWLNAAVGQQSSLSSLYMYNKYEFIPAYGGLEGSLYLTGNYRSQWQELVGKPVTQRINAHVPVYFLKGAMGASINNRKQGPQGITDFKVSYNYVLSRSWGIFSAGANLGFFQYRLDGSVLRTPDGTYIDGIIDHHDLLLGEDLKASVGGSYGFSLFFINDFVETGISFQQTPTYKINLDEGSFRYQPTINFYAETPIYIFDEYKLSPSILIQSDLIQTQVDIAVTASYSGNIFGGIGTRGYSNNTFDSILLIAGWRFDKNYSLAYAFDVGVSALRTVHQGTHEIQLNYNLNKKIGAGLPPKVIFNPRYM